MIEGTVSLKCSRCNHCEVCQWVDLKMNGCDWFEEEQRTVWIPVSERLPEDFQRVLVTIVNYKGDKVARVAEYYNYNNDKKGIFHINENHEQWEVGEKGLLAWMPLPEPYKADREVEDD